MILKGVRAIRPEHFPREPHFRLCVRACELNITPAPGSELRKCPDCGEDVWYDPRSTLWLPGETIICLQCLEVRVAKLQPGQ